MSQNVRKIIQNVCIAALVLHLKTNYYNVYCVCFISEEKLMRKMKD